jgi:hypothetical protein
LGVAEPPARAKQFKKKKNLFSWWLSCSASSCSSSFQYFFKSF